MSRPGPTGGAGAPRPPGPADGGNQGCGSPGGPFAGVSDDGLSVMVLPGGILPGSPARCRAADLLADERGPPIPAGAATRTKPARHEARRRKPARWAAPGTPGRLDAARAGREFDR